MGANGETCAALVSDSVENDESVENNNHGVISGNNCGYCGREHVGRF